MSLHCSAGLTLGASATRLTCKVVVSRASLTEETSLKTGDCFELATKATAPDARRNLPAWERQLAAAAHALLQDWAEDCE